MLEHQADAVALLHVTPLYNGTVNSTGWTTLYTVPAGDRVVLRHVRIVNRHTAAQTVQIGVGGTYVLSQVLQAFTGSPNSLDWDTWLVLGPAMTIQGATGTGHNIDIVVGGTLYTI